MRALTATRLAVVTATVLLLAGCGGSGGTATGSSTRNGLATRTATAGPVEVSVTPTALDSSGARFAVELDNHQVALDGDFAATSKLTVNGRDWASPRWAGDGPGGHHRSGTLSFTATGPATGVVELWLGGLPKPVAVTWTVQE